MGLQQVNMRRHKTLALAAALSGIIVLAVAPGLARGAGGGGHMGSGNASAGVNIGGASDPNGAFGGRSGSHISAQGSANSNGPNAVDRKFGRDRALLRMNASGIAHAHTIDTVLVSGKGSQANVHRWRHGRHHHYGWHPKVK